MDVRDIERALKRQGKTKIGLARALGRSPPTVTAILRGEREIKAREVPIIANYLGVGENLVIGSQQAVPGAEGERVDVDAIPDETLKRTLKAAIASRRQAEVWLLNTDLLDGASYLPGDYVVVDLIEAPRPRDIVLAMRREDKREIPLFRMLMPPKLWCITEKPLPPGAVVTVDNDTVAVRGVVVLRVR